LDEKIKTILKGHDEKDEAPNRTERDMLEEILELTRIGTRNKRPHGDIPSEIIMELVEGLDRIFRMLHPKMLRDPEIIYLVERPLMMLAELSGHPELRELIFRLRHRLDMLPEKTDSSKSEKS
jgi:hypothetical protein